MAERHSVIAALLGCLCLLLSGPATQASESAAESTGTGLNQKPETFELPAILSDADQTLYRRIFDIQEDGQWREADRLIQKLDNRILMGHVLFQRYMHPTDYRSSYEELSRWLDQYADHPGARRIYRLAKRRKPYDVAAPRQPVSMEIQNANAARRAAEEPRRSRHEARQVRRVKAVISRYLRRGDPDRAEKQLWATARLDILDPTEFDDQQARIAYAYLTRGNDVKARALGQLAAARSRDSVVTADWTAGLAAWRLRDYESAYQNFAALAQSETASDWTRAAGAFWASRAAVKARTPQVVVSMLEIAASHPKTFYGLIAARQLGKTPDFSWDVPVLTEDVYHRLLKFDGVERAAALREIGMTGLADLEMKLTWAQSPSKWDDAFLSLAAYFNLPTTQLTLSRNGTIAPELKTDAVSYPMPDWEPQGGFRVDRALIYAVMRQESHFNAQAVSWAGARGVMQLMPATASYIGNDRTLRRYNVSKLYEPEFNMALGQKYLRYLMEMDVTRNNLFLVTAAYNGGPGNLGKWLRRADFEEDWLLFIETIPAQETRIYVERVMANYWIYRLRLDQPVPSLVAVAEGLGPSYRAQETTVTEAAAE